MKNTVLIYTDGACSPNPGIGGWAAILIDQTTGKERAIKGAELDSTNNRMELTAAIEALKALNCPCGVQIFTDSQYLRNAFAKGWLENWRKNGWRTAAKKPVANADLWRKLIELDSTHEISWNWVRGHSENQYNDRCDELAVQAREELAAKP